MSLNPSGLSAPMAAAVFLLAVVLVLLALVARAVRRSARGDARRRAAELFRLISATLAGKTPADALRNAARRAQAESFWSAIEAIATTLRPGERRALARALERNRHVVAERRALREEDSPVRRELAARRLGLLPSLRSRAALRRALAHGADGVCWAAARALSGYRDLRALGWVLAHPQAFAPRTVRALSGLLRGFGPRARAPLIALLENGPGDMHFECAVIDALGLWRCRSARGSIEARLRHEFPEARIASARALGRLGMGEAIPSLMLALSDPAWPVRAQSAHALGRLRAVPAIELLVERVSDPAWWVRHHAAYALAALGSEGRDALCEMVVRSGDPYAREMARDALDHGVRRMA